MPFSLPFAASVLVLAYSLYVQAGWILFLTGSQRSSLGWSALFPRGVDAAFDGAKWREPAVPLEQWIQRALWNLGLLLLFAAQHSLMARPAFKAALIRRGLPAYMEQCSYVFWSALMQHLLIAQYAPLPARLYDSSGLVRSALEWLQQLGVAFTLYNTLSLDFFELMGVQQAWKHKEAAAVPHNSDTNGSRPKQKRKQKLVVSGSYGVVRHPMMTGMLAMWWIVPDLSVGRLMLNVMLTAYIYIAVCHLEEADLRDEFPEYDVYAEKVPAFVPTSLHSHSPELEPLLAEAGDQGGRTNSKQRAEGKERAARTGTRREHKQEHKQER